MHTRDLLCANIDLKANATCVDETVFVRLLKVNKRRSRLTALWSCPSVLFLHVVSSRCLPSPCSSLVKVQNAKLDVCCLDSLLECVAYPQAEVVQGPILCSVV